MSLTPQAAGAFVDATAVAIGMPIPSDFRPSVVQNMQGVLALAQLVLSFPLPQDVAAVRMFDQ